MLGLPNSGDLQQRAGIATRHLALELALSQPVKTRPCRLDNLARRLDATECGERIPATSSRVFGDIGGTERFEPQGSQNYPHECGSAIRLRLVSWNPLGRERRIRRGTEKRILRPSLNFWKRFAVAGSCRHMSRNGVYQALSTSPRAEISRTH